MNIAPQISVLMPVYNAEKYLKEAIDSILNQTYENFIFLIINDGSTDDSEKIIKHYRDSRIHYFRNDQNKGLIFTLNKGLELVTTKYMVRMDADDISHPKRLEILLDLMNYYLNISVLGSGMNVIGTHFEKRQVLNKSIVNPIKINTISTFNCPLIHPSVIIRMDFLKNNNLKYNFNYPHAEDSALWVDSMLLGELSYIKIPLINYRKHENQVSNKYCEIQKINSTLKRIELFESITSLLLSDKERKQYRALSFKEEDLGIVDFYKMGSFTQKLLNGYNNQSVFEIDVDLFKHILYKRIRIVYMKNATLGLPLFWNYFANFLFDFRSWIGVKLFIKTFVYECKKI
jgi:glycosyltransferase involved in cell wall biosynthesis